MFVVFYLRIFLKNYPGKEGSKLFRKPMKMRNLEAWGVPSYMVDIWEENYSSDLLEVQEEAIREYGVLDFNGSKGLPRRCAPRNDRVAMTEGKYFLKYLLQLEKKWGKIAS